MKVLIYGLRGCLGDIQISLFALNAYATKHPDHEIFFYWEKKEFIELAYFNPNIREILPNSLNINRVCKNEFNDFDRIYNVGDDVCCAYEELVYPNIDKSRTEVLCDILDDCYDYVNPQVYLLNEEVEAALEYKNKHLKDKFTIGVVSRTHSPVRNYDHFDGIYEYLPTNCQVLIFKKFNIDFTDVGWDMRNTTFFIGEPLRKVISLLSVCDVVIGCDTGLMHVAGGLGVPTIWLFGPTSTIATKEYKNVTTIQNNSLCKHSPCWYNMYCEKFPVDKQIHCLKNIEPKHIWKEVKEIHNKWRKV
jgi:ADP-heptose:LPS heptosyltransferase